MTAATFHDVNFSDGRILALGGCWRAVRVLVDGVILGLGSVAMGGALVATVVVAAAWILSIALATNPNLRTKPPIHPVIALADPMPRLADAEVTGSVRVSSDPADAPTFEAKWGRAMAEAYSVSPSPTRAEPEIADAPDSKVVAELTPAAVPPSAPAGALTRPPPPAAKPANREPLPPPAREKRVTPQQAQNEAAPLPDPDNHTAVYDIAAHTVYLPDGEKLEAHSGLGNELDDPRYVNVRGRGPTPPNVYDLVLREQLFHGVRALRLKPVADDPMFGRDGMLAHTYMLGANGQSNGCVSFKDYPAFLHAYLKGEVDRLVVVRNLGNTSWRTASARGGAISRYADNNQQAPRTESSQGSP